jgi:hypothetical protein
LADWFLASDGIGQKMSSQRLMQKYRIDTFVQ